MDILTNPQLAVEANSFFGFIAYFLYHVAVISATLTCVALLGILIAFTLFPRDKTLRVRIVSEFSRGRFFPMGQKEMLQGVVDELNSLHGDGKYWLEFK